MYLRSRLLLAGIILFFNFLLGQAQTLYWVGGSGNFNDPQHWSLSSGGPSANLIPSASNDVFFDDASGYSGYEVNLDGQVSVHSLKLLNSSKWLKIAGTGNLNLGGSFILSPFCFFEYKGGIHFNSSSATINKVFFNLMEIPGDLSFGAGRYEIDGLRQTGDAKTTFEGGKYRFRKATLNAEHLEIRGTSTEFRIDTSYFFIKKSLNIPDASVFETSKFSLYAPYHLDGAVNINPSVNFGSSSKLSSSNVSSVCEASVYAFPACSGSCSGVFSVVIDPTCTGTLITIDVNNSNCGTTALALSTTQTSFTWVVTNVCYCPGTSFNVTIYDENFNVIPILILAGQVGGGSNFNFTPPSFGLSSIGVPKPPSCAASCDGTVALNLTGGTPPYTVSVSGPIVNTFTTSGVFTHTSGLCAGVYTYTFTDKFACTGSAVRTVTAPTTLSANPITQSISCFGAANGSFSIRPTGGTPNYTVVFSPGGTFTTAPNGTISLTGLAPTAISATVTDSKGCTAVTNTSIIQPSQFTVVPGQTNISCGGSCSGIGSVTVTGVSGGTGAGTYSYSWSPASGNAATNSSLCAGVNQVTITDVALGCSTVQAFNILQIPPITITGSVTDVVCNGSLTGAYNATLAGGTPGYVVTLVNAVTLATLQTVATTTLVSLTGIGAGSYSLFVRDAVPCFTVFQFAVTQPTAVSLSVTNTQSNTCPGASAGAFTLSATDGQGGPYTYTWSLGTGNVNTGIAAGSYTAIASDASLCVSNTVAIVILQPQILVTNLTPTNIACRNASTGVIVAATTGTTGPYTYTLSGPTGSLANGTSTFSGLPAGTYSVFAGDNAFPTTCTQFTTITLTEPLTLPSSSILSISNPSCNGSCDGAITGTASGGTGPYTYNWITPTTSINNTVTISQQCAGSYTLNVLDNNGCPAAQTVTALVAPPIITISAPATSITCFGLTNGQITTTVGGGTPGYNYNWTGPGAFSATTPSIGSLAPGNYTLNLTDLNSCAASTVVLVAAPATSVTVSQSFTGTSCASLCDGTVIATAANGIAPYTYSFVGTPSSTNTTGIFNNVCGPYTVNVQDANLCATSVSSTVPVPPVLSVSNTFSHVTCFGLCNGSFTTTPSGGGATYNYTLTGPSPLTTNTTAPTGATAIFSSLCTGTYVLSVANNTTPATCSQTFAVVINQPTAALAAVASTVAASCFSVCNGQLLASNATGGTSPYTYQWTSTLTTTPGQTLGAQCAGNYTLTVTDNNSCTLTTGATISEPSPIVINSTPVHVTCFGLSNGQITTTVSGGSPGYNYNWSGPGAFSATTPSISALASGNYTLNLTDANTCTSQAVVTVTAPTASVTVSQSFTSTSCSSLCDGIVVATATNGTGAYTYSFVGTPSSTNTTGIFNNVCGPYTVNVQDANLCAASVSSTVPVPPVLAVSNTFSHVTCFGLCNGSFTTTPSGGGATYNYTLTGQSPLTTNTTAPTGATAIFSSLCTGTYVLSVANNTTPATCSQTFAVVINQPTAALAAVASTVAASCFSVCDGQLLSSNATGGTAPFTYQWTSSLTTIPGQTLGAQCAGNYTLTVTDNNSCSLTLGATISEPQPITILPPVISSVSCFGASTGSAVITPTGGPSSTYTVNWSPGAFTGTSITGVPAGTYIATVLSGTVPCSQTFAIVISQPTSGITLTATAVPVKCLGSCDGGATITIVSGGVAPPFTYSLGSLPSQLSNTFANLCAGNPLATVTDSNSCTATITVPIGSPTSSVSISSISTQSSCAVCSGSAAVFASGGTGALTYSYVNGSGTAAGNSSTVNSLCPTKVPGDTYTVTVADANSCTAVQSFTVPEVVIVIVASSGSVSCAGAMDGTATASAAGGLPGYNYLWSPSSQTTQLATGLAAGIYSVQVSDSNIPIACVSTQTINIAPVNAISITSLVVQPSCANTTDGSITIGSVSGGPSTSYSFSWTSTNTFVSTSQNANNIGSGTYSLSITSGTGVCSSLYTFAIVSPSVITNTFSVTQPSNCISPTTGVICANLGGGNGTYTLSWSPGAFTTNCINNLSPNNYILTVNSGSCSQNFSTTINLPVSQSLTPLGTQSISCNGASTGVATFSTSAPSPQFTWSPATASVVTSGTTSATSLIANTTYTLRYSDINSCSNSATVLVGQAPAMVVNTVVANVSCNSGTNGAISLTVSAGTPGTPAYTFSWSTGTTGSGTVSSITSLTAGTNYSVTITDGNNCSIVRNFTVTQPVPFTITNTFTNVSCFGFSTGVISITPSSTTNVTYNWPPVGTWAGSTTPVVSSLTPGIYTVVVSNGTCNASGTNTFQITQPTQMTGSVIINHNVTCFGGNNGTASYSVSGGTTPYTYSWTGNASTTTLATTFTAGTYSATATDTQGCILTTSFAIAGPSAFDATLTPFNPLCPGASNGSITTVVAGAQGNVSYSWNPAGTGQSPTGLNAGTGSLTYTLNASDDSLCVLSKTVTLIDPPAISVNIASINPVCFGQCDASATVTPVNTIGTPTITWLPMNVTGASQGSLCSNPTPSNTPNIYTINVLDANTCSSSFTLAFNTPAQITATSSVADASCGVPTGSIGVQASGGTGTLNFLWTTTVTGSPSSPVQTGLLPNIYVLTITDANTCTATFSVPVGAADGPTATPSFTNINCNGDSTGVASLSGVNPSNATFSWTPAVPGSGTLSTASGLGAGTYTVAVINPTNGCTNYYGFTITQPTPINIVASSTISTCYGICDGAMSFTVSGGTLPQTVTVNGPTGFTGTATSYTGLCGGDYTISVLDANNCLKTQIVSLTVLNSITINSVITNNTCFSDCAGTASINVVSTTTLSNAAIISWSNGQNGNFVSGLCTGIYSVLVTDTRGCSDSYSVVISSNPEMTVTPTIVSPNCGQCNGTASLAVSGGTGTAYTFSWSSGENTSDVANKCAGLYQVLVKDAANCSQLQNVVFNSSSGITGETISVQDEICASPCSGAATVLAVGGQAPISYSWINPNISINASSAASLCPGVYFVQMTDANACVRTTSLEVEAASTLSLNTFVIPPTCSVSPPDGYIRVEVFGNSGPVTYSWIPGGATTPTVSGVGPGTYTILITEAPGGCVDTAIVNISNSSGPQITASQTNIICGTGLGSITTTVLATGTASFAWSNGQSSANVGSLQAGPVTLTVTDGNGCISTKGFTISATPEIELYASIQSLRCNKDCNGVINLLPLNGTLPYSFSLTSANLASPSTVITTSSLCAGTYTAIIADQSGCRDTTVMNIVDPTAVTATVNSQNSTCSTLANGTATVSSVGGSKPYTYLWTGPSAFTSTATTLSNLLSGTYTVNATDSLGCKSKDVTMFLAPNVTIVANAGPDFSVCPGSDVVLSGTNSIGAVGFGWYLAVPGPTIASTSTLELNATESMTLFLEALSPLAGCTAFDTAVVFVYEKPFLDPGIQSYTIPVLSTTVIGGHPTSLLGGPTHTWAPAQYLDDPFAQNPVTNNTVMVTFTVSINYGDGCLVSDTVNVSILPEVRITTGFSPNDDGKNDRWIIDYIDQFPNNEVEVYNRWGDQVFYSKGYEIPFDGTFHGQPLPVGTYYYVIKLNHSIYSKPYTGALTIFR